MIKQYFKTFLATISINFVYMIGRFKFFGKNFGCSSKTLNSVLAVRPGFQ